MKGIDAQWFRDHRVFPRVYVAIFIYVCVDANFWLQGMVEVGKITGDLVLTAYISALVGGFVAIVVGYASTGEKAAKQEKPEWN